MFPQLLLSVIETKAMHGGETPEPLAAARWDWSKVRKVLLVRLRSIGDTVLSTPSLFALRRFLPNAQIDILVEDWVAPVLDSHPYADNVVVLERGGLRARSRTAWQLRSTGYDVVYNLHGGTTATFLTRASGARHRVGLKTYQYAQLHNHQAPSPLLLRVVLLLESGGNSRLGLKKLGDWAGMSFGYFGVLSSMLGRIG